VNRPWIVQTEEYSGFIISACQQLNRLLHEFFSIDRIYQRRLLLQGDTSLEWHTVMFSVGTLIALFFLGCKMLLCHVVVC
jgi:hypothetical protein